MVSTQCLLQAIQAHQGEYSRLKERKRLTKAREIDLREGVSILDWALTNGPQCLGLAERGPGQAFIDASEDALELKLQKLNEELATAHSSVEEQHALVAQRLGELQAAKQHQRETLQEAERAYAELSILQAADLKYSASDQQAAELKARRDDIARKVQAVNDQIQNIEEHEIAVHLLKIKRASRVCKEYQALAGWLTRENRDVLTNSSLPEDVLESIAKATSAEAIPSLKERMHDSLSQEEGSIDDSKGLQEIGVPENVHQLFAELSSQWNRERQALLAIGRGLRSHTEASELPDKSSFHALKPWCPTSLELVSSALADRKNEEFEVTENIWDRPLFEHPSRHSSEAKDIDNAEGAASYQPLTVGCKDFSYLLPPASTITCVPMECDGAKAKGETTAVRKSAGRRRERSESQAIADDLEKSGKRPGAPKEHTTIEGGMPASWVEAGTGGPLTREKERDRFLERDKLAEASGKVGPPYKTLTRKQKGP